MESLVQVTEISTWGFIPKLLAWGLGIVLAAVMLRRGGGRAEKLLLAGCCLFFVASLAIPLLWPFLQQYLSGQGMTNREIVQVMGWAAQIPVAVLTLAGLVCLVWGFWLRFPGKKAATL